VKQFVVVHKGVCDSAALCVAVRVAVRGGAAVCGGARGSVQRCGGVLHAMRQRATVQAAGFGSASGSVRRRARRGLVVVVERSVMSVCLMC
jgi:predicted short-subunit dehydrogenase-like oxidoreductase (DUF2520 family)